VHHSWPLFTIHAGGRNIQSSQARRFESRSCSQLQLPSIDILASLKDSASSSPTTVFAGSENQVAASYADEVMVVTETWDHAARLKSCRLDAEVRKEIQIGSKHCGRKTNISIKKNPAPDESQDPWPHLNNRKIDLNVKRRL
jgi:hypothetical protein